MPAPAYVASTTRHFTGVDTTGPGNTATVTVPFAISPGQFVILGYCCTGDLGPGIDIDTITDDGGNTWSTYGTGSQSDSQSPIYNFNSFILGHATAPATTITLHLLSLPPGNTAPDIYVIVGSYANLTPNFQQVNHDQFDPPRTELQNNNAGHAMVSL